MTKSGLPNSARKFLRKEKARLRREISDSQEAERRIKELMELVASQHRKTEKTAEKKQSPVRMKTPQLA